MALEVHMQGTAGSRLRWIAALGLSFAVVAGGCRHAGAVSAARRAGVAELAAASMPGAASLPPARSWVEHLSRDLAPFWTSAAALGPAPGEFPTFRCNDGQAWDPAQPCPELGQAPDWIRSELGREYTRMRARQVSFYCAAFSLTGEAAMLRHARDGVEWIRRHALEPSGSAVSWFEHGQPAGPPVLARTSQDLAYANLALAAYANLTRDEGVMADARRLKDHVFTAYAEPSSGLLRWVARGEGEERQELVAVLDQINAYMLLLAPIEPEPVGGRWRAELARLCHLIIDRFWSEEHGMFRGTLHEPGFYGTRHTDFGHTVKSLWMIERTGLLVGDAALVRFARTNAPRVLARAFRADAGCWASGVDGDGSLDRGLTWWTFAELDQMAATLALVDRRATGWLARTYPCWQAGLVDHEHGEVWGFADPDDPERHFSKAQQWKNGYHSAEHALVSYITTAALEGTPARLYFAVPTGTAPLLRPYVFDGHPRVVSRSPLAGFPGHDRIAVDFTDIR